MLTLPIQILLIRPNTLIFLQLFTFIYFAILHGYGYLIFTRTGYKHAHLSKNNRNFKMEHLKIPIVLKEL